MTEDSICKREINTFLKSIGTNLTATVDLLNKRNSKQTTLQNLYNKLAKDTIRFIEVMDIADVNGYKVCFLPKDEPDLMPVKEEHEPPKETYKPDAAPDAVTTLISEGTASMETKNGEYLFVGKQCHEAKQRFIAMQEKNMPDAQKEIYILKFIEGIYDVMILKL